MSMNLSQTTTDHQASAESFCQIIRLPDQSLVEGMERLILDDLTAQALPNYLNMLTWLGNQGASTQALALRRGVLIYGAPGTGKTTLATGLPNQWAQQAGQEGFLFITNTHTLRSEKYGETEKRVRALFNRIGEVASTGLATFVVVDEVESIASDRATINSETNPLDAVYSVNAVLESLDEIVRRYRNVTFLFTTNIPRLVDRAISERVDFAIEVDLPDFERRGLILVDALSEIDRLRGGTPDVSWSQAAEWPAILTVTAGLSPRELRHLPVQALMLSGSPEKLTAHEVLQAANWLATQAQRHTETGGVYTHSFQRSSTPAPLVERRISGGQQPPIVEEHQPQPSLTDAPQANAVLEEVAGQPDSITPVRQLHARRYIAVLPRRSPAVAWRLASKLLDHTLRGGGCDDEYRPALDMTALTQLGQALLASHALDGGFVDLSWPGLSLIIHFNFGLSGPDEDMSPVPVEALVNIPEEAVPTLTFGNRQSVGDPYLLNLVRQVNATKQIQVEILNLTSQAA